MKVTVLRTCRIGLLTAFLAAGFPEVGLAASLARAIHRGEGNLIVFQLSSTPLENSRGG
jgi:hypothetical protein